MYQRNDLIAESLNDNYRCMAVGGSDKNIHLFTVSGAHTAYQLIQYVDEYDIKSVVYGNGVYMAAAVDKIIKSTDGENWTVVKEAVATPPMRADVTKIAY